MYEDIWEAAFHEMDETAADGKSLAKDSVVSENFSQSPALALPKQIKEGHACMLTIIMENVGSQLFSKTHR